MLDRADDRVTVYPADVVEVALFASVTEKEPVELCARNFASRFGLDESAGSQATDAARARLRE